MIDVVLRITGRSIDFMSILAKTGWTPIKCYRSGDSNRGKQEEYDGMHILVAEDKGVDCWKTMIPIVSQFLERHKDTLQSLRHSTNTDMIVLDVGASPEHKDYIYLGFDNCLVSLIAESGISLEISVYK